ncbi:hypothetical protein VFPPC_17978 [Pochonia chlamydosporia 170]|uniref:Uncharacterized protein n=1 Tax=Pochonia chlamydosporia 170 TaxID=1380566 RepID=A0A219AQD2_METCM|nr:hypothetical protein VFPPC_17978 [Pochonia chlamydosporia 170]OWT42829.1 hypothetical protein VFPPC_17978 [Pochonia chlamydosporia 170]
MRVLYIILCVLHYVYALPRAPSKYSAVYAKWNVPNVDSTRRLLSGTSTSSLLVLQLAQGAEILGCYTAPRAGLPLAGIRRQDVNW